MKKEKEKIIGFLFGCKLVLRGDEKNFDEIYELCCSKLAKVYEIYFKEYSPYGHHPKFYEYYPELKELAKERNQRIREVFKKKLKN